MTDPAPGVSSVDADRPHRAPPVGVCMHAHPLLEEVHCQRLRGHPGHHGAEIETASAEIYVEWSGEEEQARAG